MFICEFFCDVLINLEWGKCYKYFGFFSENIGKAKKILDKARLLGAEPRKLVMEALRKLESGETILMSKNDRKYSTLNRNNLFYYWHLCDYSCINWYWESILKNCKWIHLFIEYSILCLLVIPYKCWTFKLFIVGMEERSQSL